LGQAEAVEDAVREICVGYAPPPPPTVAAARSCMTGTQVRASLRHCRFNKASHL
jgi:hypothetical protein